MKKINLTNYKNINLELEKYNRNFKKNCKLIAVSKKQSINSILELHSLGHCDFGENYLQEGIEKIEKINSTEIIWHFIGPIQSNKSTQIATHFDWIHSVDRIKDYNKIKKQVESSLRKKIEASELVTNAENRLISELQKIYILTSSMGWTLQYQSEPIEDEMDLERIKL